MSLSQPMSFFFFYHLPLFFWGRRVRKQHGRAEQLTGVQHHTFLWKAFHLTLVEHKVLYSLPQLLKIGITSIVATKRLFIQKSIQHFSSSFLTFSTQNVMSNVILLLNRPPPCQKASLSFYFKLLFFLFSVTLYNLLLTRPTPEVTMSTLFLHLKLNL